MCSKHSMGYCICQIGAAGISSSSKLVQFLALHCRFSEAFTYECIQAMH